MNSRDLNEVYGTIDDFHKLVIFDITQTIKVAPMGALILMLCAIDYLKRFRFGLYAIDGKTYKLLKEKYPKDGRLDDLTDFDTSKWYKQFLNDYLLKIDPRYNIEDIYVNLRCGLVHNYSDKVFKYHFIDNRSYDKSLFHLEPCPDGNTIYFNVDIFFNDFINMCKRFFEEALTKEEVLRNIFNFRSFVGFLHA